MRKWYGAEIQDDGSVRMMFCVVIGQMNDGSMVWMECDKNGELLDKEDQYLMSRRNGWTQFHHI